MEALAKGDRDVTGTPSGFRDLDNLLGRIPAGEPDRARGPAVARKVGAGLQHRRERRHQGGIAGRLLLARDVGGRARTPVHRLPGSDPERPLAQGQGGGTRLAAGCACLQRAGEGAAVARRLLRPQPARAAGQGAPPGHQSEWPGARDRRLHAADAARGPANQPGRAGRPDQPRPEDPRPRAEPAGDRRLAALPRAGAAAGQAADPLGPSRVGLASSRTRTSSPSSTGPRSTTRTPIPARRT